MKITILLSCLIFSINANADWIQTSNGLTNSQTVFSLCESGNLIFAAYYNYNTQQRGVWFSTNNGQNWSPTSLVNVTVLSLSSNLTTIFAGTTNGIYRSTNNGVSWTKTLNSLSVNSIAINENYVFAGTSNTGVYRSTNNGVNWILTSLNDRTVYSLATNSDSIFAGTGQGIFRSTNNGINWIQTSLNTDLSVYAIALNENRIIAGTGYGIYVSSNNGLTWTISAINSNLHIKCFSTKNNYIYAGTSDGIYVSPSNADYWLEYSQGLISSTVVNDLLIFDNYIFAGTNSYSVWRRDINITQSIVVNLKVSIEGLYNSSFNQLLRKDSIKLCLRNSISPFDLIDSVLNTIDTISFSNLFTFSNSPTGSYYIVVKHFNSIETWSKFGGEYLINNNSIYSYDFTNSNSKAYGNNLKLKGSKYCIYSGDINKDGFINLTDIVNVYNSSTNFVSGRYITEDLNGDNVVDLNDVTISFNNSNVFVHSIRP